jgi:hypothetical protein
LARNKDQALDDLVSSREELKRLKDLEAKSALALDACKLQNKDDKVRLDIAQARYKEAERAFRATPDA